MTMHIPITIVLVAAGMGCSTTRHTEPRPADFQLPWIEYPNLRGRTVQVVVRDHRDDDGQVDSLVKVTNESITQSLIRAGIRVQNIGAEKVEVGIMTYQADFDHGKWRGNVRFSATTEIVRFSRFPATK